MLLKKNKAKQNFILLAKILLVVTCCGYVFMQVADEQAIFLNTLQAFSTFSIRVLFIIVVLAILLSIANWAVEIFKWKLLVCRWQRISYVEATQQSLIAHAVAILTPNRIGDYGAKLYFFKPQDYKVIWKLNLIGNFFQWLVTFIFGIIGLFFLYEKGIHIFQLSWNYLVLSAFVVIIILLCWKGRYVWVKLNSFLVACSFKKNENSTIFGLSLIRYLLFSHQYFLIGWVLGWNLPYMEAMPVIFVMYLVSSSIPSFFIFDTVVKAGVGIYLFELYAVSSVLILSTTSVMWILNFAFPALLGCAMMLRKTIGKTSYTTNSPMLY